LREQHSGSVSGGDDRLRRKQDRDAAYAASFNAHLVKPADFDELHGILANGAPVKSGD